MKAKFTAPCGTTFGRSDSFPVSYTHLDERVVLHLAVPGGRDGHAVFQRKGFDLCADARHHGVLPKRGELRPRFGDQTEFVFAAVGAGHRAAQSGASRDARVVRLFQMETGGQGRRCV